MKKIYISAPITGQEDTAAQRFDDAAKMLKGQGFIAINPWRENNLCRDYGEAMVACLELLRKCDAILLCEGWQHSDGCQIEQKVARKMGIEVLFEESLKSE